MAAALVFKSNHVLFTMIFDVAFHASNLLRNPVYDHVENQFVRATFTWYLKSCSVAKIFAESKTTAIPVFDEPVVIV